MPEFRDKGPLIVKGPKLLFKGKATPGGKVREHEIPPPLWRDLAQTAGELAGRQAQVRFSKQGSVAALTLLDADGNPVAAPQRAQSRPPAAASSAADTAGPASPPTDAAPPRQTHSPYRPPPVTGPSAIRSGDEAFVPAYNFIPLIERTQLPSALACSAPAGHDRYLPDRYTGTIPITITTRTPLLIPDHATAEAITVDGITVPVYATRATGSGKNAIPILDGSAVKGMLRSGYEAITASRLGVFEAHDRRLAIRAKARAGLDYYPAVVTGAAEPGSRQVHVVLDIKPRGGPVPAGQRVNQVWIHKQQHRLFAPDLRPQTELDVPEVYAWLQLCRHESPGRAPFYFWRTVTMSGDAPPPEPATPVSTPTYQYQDPKILVRGRIHWTDGPFPMGPGRQLKHDERLVVTEILSPVDELDVDMRTMTLDGDAIAEWVEVINSYRSVIGRGDNPPPGDYARLQDHRNPERWLGLPEHRTLHVKIERISGVDIACHPSPAIIGREAFQRPPADLLPPDYFPAASVEQLSPAERVFGWTKQSRGTDRSTAAHRGHLRVDACQVQVQASPNPPIQRFNGPVALAALNSPKPSQYRFYLRNAHGSTIGTNSLQANNNEQNRAGGYRSDDVIAGRKVYLYDARLTQDDQNDYWKPPHLRRTQSGSDSYTGTNISNQTATVGGAPVHHEYCAPQGFKPRTVTLVNSWVKPQTVFRTTLHVDNLSRAELGALLWLLSLPLSEEGDGHRRPGHHRLGSGKPLGFGVIDVRFDAEATQMANGAALKRSYLAFGISEHLPANELNAIREEYDILLTGHDGLQVVRTAYLHAAWGEWGTPVHAPRPSPEPPTGDQGTEMFNWWMNNENPAPRANPAQTPRRLGLPLLAAADRRLPYRPYNVQQRRVARP